MKSPLSILLGHSLLRWFFLTAAVTTGACAQPITINLDVGFGHLGENGRKQVWGATFQTNDKTRNLVGEVPYEFDALIERLNVDLTDRLQDEPAPSTRVSLFGFPAHMAAL